MKILNFSLDNKILDENSLIAKRMIEYGELVDKYIIIVPAKIKIDFKLSEKVEVYSSGGSNKFFQLCKIFYLANRILKSNKFSLLTVQSPYFLGFLGLFLARRFNIGLEIQIHGWEKYGGVRKILAKFNLSRANSVRTVSQRLAKQLINEFGVKKEKITVVPIYVEVKNKKLEIKSLNDNKFIFLTVGRFVSVKNIRLQIEAMKEVVKKYLNIELLIIGDGPEKKNYESQIINYELGKNIKLLGWKNNLNEYYKEVDAFLLTSSSEGWGMAVIEAASFGLPIIMTDVGCAGEVIKDNESGIIIPVGDKEKLIEAMLKVIADESLRKKLGENAKLAVSQLPNKEQILDLYKKSWGIALVSKL